MESIEGLAQSVAQAVNAALLPVAEFLDHYVWGWSPPFWPVPLLATVLLGTGVWVTLRLAFIQLRGFKHAIDVTRGKYDDPEDEGDLVHFQALTTALSATVGIGNIAGVAIAIRMGGPGALFWMWVTAFFGMALKYTECTLAVAYRKVHPDGSVSGGPMYYIEKGLGRGWRWMAVLFAACAAISSFGGGCMNQSNTLADQVRSNFGIPPVYTGLVFAALVAAVIIGGIRRIGRVTSILAPAMAALYVAGALYILAVNYGQIVPGLGLIFTQAFAPEPLVGGAAGSFMVTMLWGLKRGLFSNEAGQGSAPIAHATAKTDEPVREGLVASLEPFIDTLVICTMTGLVIVMTGAYAEKAERRLALSELEAVTLAGATDESLLELRQARDSASGGRLRVVEGQLLDGTLYHLEGTVDEARFFAPDGLAWNGTLAVAADGTLAVEGGAAPPRIRGTVLLTGAPLTAQGFKHGLPGQWGDLVVTVAVVLFAVSTGISWSYYGDRSVEYLFGSLAIPIYRWVFVCVFFLGAILPLEAVWKFGDVALGLMTFPNLIALILLSGSVVKMTRAYFSREQVPYAKERARAASNEPRPGE